MLLRMDIKESCEAKENELKILVQIGKFRNTLEICWQR